MIIINYPRIYSISSKDYDNKSLLIGFIGEYYYDIKDTNYTINSVTFNSKHVLTKFK